MSPPYTIIASACNLINLTLARRAGTSQPRPSTARSVWNARSWELDAKPTRKYYILYTMSYQSMTINCIYLKGPVVVNTVYTIFDSVDVDSVDRSVALPLSPELDAKHNNDIVIITMS